MTILDGRCQCRLGTQSAERIEQLERELTREKAARAKAEKQLLEKQQGGMRYARNA